MPQKSLCLVSTGKCKFEIQNFYPIHQLYADSYTILDFERKNIFPSHKTNKYVHLNFSCLTANYWKPKLLEAQIIHVLMFMY